MKKIFPVILIAALLMNIAASAFAEAAPSVFVGSATGKKGETVEVPIVLSGNSGFMSLSIEIGFNNEVLELEDVSTNNAVDGNVMTAQYLTAMPYNLSWIYSGNCTFNGTLAILTFEILTDAVGEYPVTVDYYKGRNGNYIDGINTNYDMSYQPLGLTYQSGSVSVITDGYTIAAQNTSTAQQISCDVTLTGTEYRGIVLAALYNGNKLVSVESYIPQSSIPVSFESGLSGSYVKLMWWDGIDTMKPMCMYETVPLI